MAHLTYNQGKKCFEDNTRRLLLVNDDNPYQECIKCRNNCDYHDQNDEEISEANAMLIERDCC